MVERVVGEGLREEAKARDAPANGRANEIATPRPCASWALLILRLVFAAVIMIIIADTFIFSLLV